MSPTIKARGTGCASTMAGWSKRVNLLGVADKAPGTRAASLQALQRFSLLSKRWLGVNDLQKGATLCPRVAMPWEELVAKGCIGEPKHPHLPRPEVHQLYNLRKSRSIVWRGGEFFRRFQHLVITLCHKLKNVDRLQGLPCFTDLILMACFCMSKLVMHRMKQAESQKQKERSWMNPVLHRLRIPVLIVLPIQHSICCHAIYIPSLEYVIVFSYPELQKLHFQAQQNDSNKRLQTFGFQEWFDGLS